MVSTDVVAAFAPPFIGAFLVALKKYGTAGARRASRIAAAAQLRELAPEGCVAHKVLDREIQGDIDATLASRLVRQHWQIELFALVLGAALFVAGSVLERRSSSILHAAAYVLALALYSAACLFVAWLTSRTSDLRQRQQKALLMGRPSGGLQLSPLERLDIAAIRKAMRPRMVSGRRRIREGSRKRTAPTTGAPAVAAPTLGSGA